MASNLTTNNVPVGIGYDADGNAKGLVELSSIVVGTTLLPFVTVSSVHSVAITDRLLYVSGDSPISITLPAVATSTNRILDIHNTGTSLVTIDGNALETINGSLTIILSARHDTVTVHCDGSAWFII